MIDLTDLAAQKLQGILQEDGKANAALRIRVEQGHHGRFQYLLSLEEEPGDGDQAIHANGIRIVVDTESAPLLEGSEIDYVEGLMRSGFVITNPNELQDTGGCACGGQCDCGGH
ncbi:MAG: iron-sulfur cluster assembly accessory protein [Chloroflexi bacterium]|nr:iron-sulfur cluster assembly accessory protein [Chloroflexota bacterium]